MDKIIEVKKNEKFSTLRIREGTKRELESLGNSGETHEDIIIKLIKLAKSKYLESRTKIIEHNNIQATQYSRISRVFHIKTETRKYALVCTFNDLSLMVLITGNKNLQEKMSGEWELDLEIVNIKQDIKKHKMTKKDINWSNPDIFYDNDKHEFALLYFIAIKQVLEDMFGVIIYEIMTEDDYFNYEKWKSAYLRNSLSMESYYKDIEKKIR